MPRDPQQILMLAGASLVVIELAILILYRPQIGLWTFAIASALSYSGLGSGFAVGTLQLTTLDLSTIVLVPAIIRWLPIERLDKSIGIIVVLLGIASLRGIAEFGVQSAFHASRGLLYPFVGATFVMVCFGADAWQMLQRIWVWASAIFVVAGMVFLARYGLSTYVSRGERALNSSQALIVAQSAVLGLGSEDRRRVAFSMVCFFMVLASQQRTVWACTLTAVAVLTINSDRLSNHRSGRRIRIAVLSLTSLTLIALLAGPQGLGDSVSTSTSTISTDSGTFGWRLTGWGALIDSFALKSGMSKLIGQPAGTGFARLVDGGVVTASPHNMYLTVLISVGVVGLVALIIFYGRALRRSLSQSVPLFALVSGLVVFSIGYQIGPEQGLLLGAALAFRAAPAMRERRVRVAE